MHYFKYIILFVFLFSFQNCFSVYAFKPADVTLNDNLRRFWTSIDRIIVKNNERLSPVSGEIEKIAFDLNQAGSKCYQAIEFAFRNGVHEQWTAKMLSANSFASENFISNLINDQFSSLRNFESCLSLENIQIQDFENVTFDGKYCLASVFTPQLQYERPGTPETKQKTHAFTINGHFEVIAKSWLNIRNRFPVVHGICVPSVCGTEEVKVLIEKYFEPYLDGLDVQVGYCQQKKPSDLDSSSTFAYSFSKSLLIIFIFTNFIGTIVYSVCKIIKAKSESLSQRSLDYTIKFTECFHLGHNFNQIFKVHPAKHQNHSHDLTFIHGAKAIYMIFVVMFHCMLFMPVLHQSKVAIFGKYPSFLEWVKGPMNNFTERCFFGMNSFFFISGFLVTYMSVTKFETRMPNFGIFALSRYIRLVPSVVAILCLTIVAQGLSRGPLMHHELTDPYVKPCSEYWWTHVFFINNYFTFDKMCGLNMWFVSTDFQLHLLVYPILWSYFDRKSSGVLASLSVIVTALLIFSYLVIFNGVRVPYNDFFMNFKFELLKDNIRTVYFTPLLHSVSFFQATVFAFYVIKNKDRRPMDNKLINYLALLLFTGVQLCYFAPLQTKYYSIQNEFHSLGETFIFLFIFLAHNLFWMGTVYCIMYGPQNFWLKKWASAQFMVPFSRLTYGIYLVNIMIIWFNVQQVDQPQQLSYFFMAQTFITVYFECVILALFMYVFVEAPFNNLFKLVLFGSAHNKITVDSSNNYNNNNNNNQFENGHESVQLTQVNMNVIA